MSEHTQGPWFHTKDNRIVNKVGRTVADARYRNVEADGPLLAAAPELLEALKIILRNRELGEYESQIQGFPRMIEANELARAAIAKAAPEEMFKESR